MSTNTYLFSIKAFSIFDIFSAAYYFLYFSIFLFSESLSKMPRQAGDKRPRLDEDGDQEVLIFTVCIYVFMYMYMYINELKLCQIIVFLRPLKRIDV